MNLKLYGMKFASMSIIVHLVDVFLENMAINHNNAVRFSDFQFSEIFNEIIGALVPKC